MRRFGEAAIRLGLTKAGLIMCRLGDAMADAGARMAGCQRRHSILHPMYRTNGELDTDAEARKS